MVRVTDAKFVKHGVKYFEFAGSSLDDKPTDGVCTGSLFHETDTTDVYAYDESTETWYKQLTLGSE